MRLRPNDAPCMEVGEKRNFVFKLSGAVGVNSISEAEVSAPRGLTIGTRSINGTTVTVPVTAAQTGLHVLKVSAELSSSETIIGVVRVKVEDSTLQTGTRSYG